MYYERCLYFKKNILHSVFVSTCKKKTTCSSVCIFIFPLVYGKDACCIIPGLDILYLRDVLEIEHFSTPPFPLSL